MLELLDHRIVNVSHVEEPVELFLRVCVKYKRNICEFPLHNRFLIQKDRKVLSSDLSDKRIN